MAAEARRPRPRQLLDRMRRDDPDTDTIDAADPAYYAELVRREQLDVDAQQVRTYFDFAGSARACSTSPAGCSA